MGRKGPSGMKPTVYKSYATSKESWVGMGYTNGGATDQWMNSLSLDERAAVHKYTTGFYHGLNHNLRYDTELNDSQKKVDEGLKSVISKYELTEPTIFVRGGNANMLGGASTVDEINAMVGSTVMDKAYVSTSAHEKGGFSAAVKYHIHTPAGKGIGAYIVGLSNFKKENEFLFDKGSAFRVMGAYKDKKGQVHCNLEYIGHA